MFTNSIKLTGSILGRRLGSDELTTASLKGYTSPDSQPTINSIFSKFIEMYPDTDVENHKIIKLRIKEYLRNFSNRKAVDNWTGDVGVKYGERLTNIQGPLDGKMGTIIKKIRGELELMKKAALQNTGRDKLSAYEFTRSPVAQASLNRNRTTRTAVRENINVSRCIKGKRMVKAGIIKTNMCP